MDGRADVFLVGTEQKDELGDYVRLCASSEVFVCAAMSRLMVRRLTYA